MGGNRTELPNDPDADSTFLEATETFKVLGNETRLAILLELWRSVAPFEDEPPDPTQRQVLSFSELRNRVDYGSTSNFAYHLEQLLGSFVQKSDEGYQLLPAGDNLIHAIVASAGYINGDIPPQTVETACPECGGTTAITYQRQRLYHVCTHCDGIYDVGDEERPSGILGAWISNPAILGRGSPQEILEAVRTEVFHRFSLRLAGICPKCSGRVTWGLHVCDDHRPRQGGPCPHCLRETQSMAKFDCTLCKNMGINGVESISLHHPAVMGFFWQHDVALGYNLRDTTHWVLNAQFFGDTEVIETEPSRVRVRFRLDGDEVGLTYDEDMNVEVTENWGPIKLHESAES